MNARGGVNGRTIEYRVVADAGDPVETAEAVRRLVDEEGVFAVFNSRGTESNLAIRDALNQSRVPQVFVAARAATFGRDFRRYPWTIGYSPSYRAEGLVLARQALKSKPRARIAVLYAEDGDGAELLAGFRRGLGARAGQIVAALPAENVRAQVGELSSAKANVFAVLVFGTAAAEAQREAARLGWRPQVYLASGAVPATRNAVAIAVFKDPADPHWRGDRALAPFRRTARNAESVAGMASAFTFVDAVRSAGRPLTRAKLVAATRSLIEANNPFVVPGITIRTSRTDGFPIEQVALQRWTGTRWNLFTGPLTVSR